MKKLFFVSLVTGLVTTLVSAQESKHIVKIGETLTGILSQHNLYPIYGRQGKLAETLDLNPKIKKNGDLIYPGQNILLNLTAQTNIRSEKGNTKNKSEPTDSNELAASENLNSADSSGLAGNDLKTEQPRKLDLAKMKMDVAAGVGFFRIDGRDNLLTGNATILSEATPSLALGLTLIWDEKSEVRTEIGYQKYKLQDLNDGRSFTKNADDLVSFSLMYTRKVTPHLTLGAGAKVSEEIFFRAVSLNEITVNQVFIIKPTITAKYDVFQKDNAGIGVYGDLSYLSSAKTSYYDIEGGTGFELGAYYYYNSHLLPIRSLFVKTGYVYEEQDTSVALQNRSGLNLKVGYQWGFDW